MTRTEAPLPLSEAAMVVDPDDDLAVARWSLPAGLRLSWQGGVLTLSGAVHPKHKFALRALVAGEPVRMYGAPVGTASAPIAAGDPVTQSNLSDRLSGTADAGTYAGAATLAPPEPMPTFLGIHRGPGGVGTRNHLLIAYTVPCAATVASRVAAACRTAYGYDRGDSFARYARERLGGLAAATTPPDPTFPGVDDIVVLHHHTGCGMPDHGDLEAFARWLAHYIRNPNVGGALLLALGCEKARLDWLDRDYLQPIREATGKPVEALAHQMVGSEDAVIRAGIDRAHEILCQIQDVERVPVPLARLVLGTKCGGSDGFSGLSANPALGWVSDRVVAAGGTVLLPEVPEMFGAEKVLAARAASPSVAALVHQVVERYAQMAARWDVRLAENPSQGNIADGLLTIQMKSLGAVRKAGTGPIAGVLEYGEWAPEGGVYLLASPGYDVISTAALPASGATLICFTTGLGTPYGNPVAPVVKVSSNTPLFRHMPDVLDFDAGTVVTGRETVAECGERLLAALLDFASGRRTRNEEHEHRESGFWVRQCHL